MHAESGNNARTGLEQMWLSISGVAPALKLTSRGWCMGGKGWWGVSLVYRNSSPAHAVKFARRYVKRRATRHGEQKVAEIREVLYRCQQPRNAGGVRGWPTIYRSNYRVVRYGFMQIPREPRGSFGINAGWTNVSRFFCWIIVPSSAAKRVQARQTRANRRENARTCLYTLAHARTQFPGEVKIIWSSCRCTLAVRNRRILNSYVFSLCLVFYNYGTGIHADEIKHLKDH